MNLATAARRSRLGSHVLLVRAWWGAAATRMTLAYAARGTLAMVVPFVVLLVLGFPYGGVLASLGGMFAILADTEGNYRRRNGAMALALVVGAASIYVGVLVADTDWLAAPILAAIAFGTGMARAFGSPGISIGLSASIMFLVGALSLVQDASAIAFAVFYMVGALWVMGMHMVQWRLRPYRILLQEIAACYDDCARLVTVLELAAAGRDSQATRRRVRTLHQNARESIRNAEATLESVRVGVGYSSPVFDRALLMLAAVSREVIAATGLRSMDWPQPDSDEAQAWRDWFSSWRRALLTVSRLLLSGRGEVSTTDMHAAFAALEAREEVADATAAPLRLALLHMDGVAETGARLTSFDMTWRDVLPDFEPGRLPHVWAALATNLTPRSLIFRHALRVAVASGFGLWFAALIALPHRLWVPMTTLLVLQPEFGATWKRMGQRVAGTLGGVLIAGGLHFLIYDPVAEIVVITLFAFTSFYFIRSAYGIGVVLLTPMVLLLIGVLQPQAAGMLTLARGIDTVIGGILALGAAYVLWPSWQRHTFLPQCATALRAEYDYLSHACNQPGDGELSRPELMRARHEAERAADNADATLRRMLAEPRDERGNTRGALSFMTYVRRLADNATHFTVTLRGETLSLQERVQADEILQRLELLACVLDGSQQPQVLADMTPQLDDPAGQAQPNNVWFERLAADTAMLAIAVRRLVQR